MKKTIALVCILCCTLPDLAQKNGFLLHDIRLPEQFSQQIFSCLVQDKSGLLWFVTGNGLYRYDGSDVIHLDRESTPSIPHADIITLFADRKSDLWIGAKDGLTRLDLKNWVSTEIKSKSGIPALSLYIRTVCEDRLGNVYAGSQDGKVFKVVSDSLALLLDVNQSLPGLYDLPNITFIQEPYPNQLWIGTSLGKLIQITIKEDGSYSAPKYYGLDEFKGEQIMSATFSTSGKCLMIVPGHGLYILNTHTGAFDKARGKYGDLGKSGQAFLAPLNTNETLMLTNAPSIGKKKLLIYNFNKDTIFEQDLHFPDYLKDDHIVRFSHTGSMIVLSLNAQIMEIAPSQSPFTPLMAEPKSLNSIRAIYKQPGGDLFVGSYKDGFVRMNEEKGEKEVIARKYVYSILPWGKDTLLLSTEGDGLLWYEPQKNRLTQLDFPSNKTQGAPMGRYLTFLLRQNNHQLLVGTYERLYEVDPYKRSARVIQNDRLSKTRMLSVLQQGGNYFIATEKGILRWNDRTGSVDNFWDNESSAGQSKIAVYGMISIGNEIWAGTDGKGILVLNKEGKVVDSIGHAEGLASNIVFTLTATGKYVLAGTQNGLSVINKKPRVIINYSTLDQLPANEFNSAAAFQRGDTVYLGTTDGVVRFNTGQLRDAKADALLHSLYITDLSITDHKGQQLHDYTWPYHPNRTILIPSGTEYFTIDFGNMSGTSQTLNYYYRLQEDNEWSLLGSPRKLTFVGMSPGAYQLQLAARLPDGKWTSPLLTRQLVVKAAFYQTIGFKLLVGLFVIGLAWWIFRYRERQKDKERLLRLQIAGDLHDEVGSSLAGISMQADMLLSGHYEHLKEYLQSIADNGRIAVQTMGDIVWSIDPRNDDNISLLQRMERYGHKVFGASAISITFHNEGFNEKQHMTQKVRQNIMLIFKESLTNIVKHAQASQVDIIFTSLNKGFRLVIADNGKGISLDPAGRFDEEPSGHGLRNIKMRAAAIGADLSFPTVQQGVMIQLIWKG